MLSFFFFFFFFFFNDTATTEIYTLSLHDALPIRSAGSEQCDGEQGHQPHRTPSSATGSSPASYLGEVFSAVAAGTRAQTTGALREACSGRSPRLRSIGVYRA